MTETAGTLHGENSEADDVSAEPAEETLTSAHPGGDSLEPATADLLTGRSMDRRLPSLIRRTFSLAWEVGPKAVLALLACQVVSGIGRGGRSAGTARHRHPHPVPPAVAADLP
ncbi:hypothetical protein ACFXKC_33360 [Streptomyces sp. NPDC059340]|uniref:hypothetical protein n=1 Tax=Streptomyces sp. NPDC059340 TaxID=3346806 RepID=UPI0036A3AFEB